MNSFIVTALLFLLMIVTFSGSNSFAAQNLCPHVILEEGKLKLNANEKVLICGTDKDSPNWKEIPLLQAELHLRSILQNIGYLSPRFDRTGDVLKVWSGPLDEVKILKTEGDSGELRPGKKRNIVGEPMMPRKLNEVEAWANLKVRSQGYACPKITVEAHAWDGTVLVMTGLDGKKVYGSVNPGDMDGLNQDILDRYQPFNLGEPYDIRQPEIMTLRMLRDGLFQSAYFVTTCAEDQAHLELRTSVGKPKIFRFGIGASTEEFPFVDITVRNARLDNKASFFTAHLLGSPRRQSLLADSELYWFPGWHRTFFGPRFEVSHKTEEAYEENSAKLGADVGRNWDQDKVRFTARGGPTLNYVKTLRGVGPTDETYSSFEASLTAMNHVYEFSIRDQYEGWNAGVYYRGRRKGLGSEIEVDRIEFNFKHLWNLGEFSPPFLVLGSRIQTITVNSDELVAGANQDLLSSEERIFMGGDQNLRGFPRQSIDNNKLGFLTAAYLGFELRLIEELPFHLQPFLLWDAAKVGNRRYTLDQPVFTSEGLGLRWASPFGTLRGSIARGHVLNGNTMSDPYPEQWIYFISFGQEF